MLYVKKAGMARAAIPPHSKDEKRINVAIPTHLHRRLRSALAMEGKTMRQWLIEQAEAATEKAAPGRRAPS
jgi:predicted HicB family RNase H-like nuclease